MNVFFKVQSRVGRSYYIVDKKKARCLTMPFDVENPTVFQAPS